MSLKIILLMSLILFLAELPQVESLCFTKSCENYCRSKGAKTGKCIPNSPNGSCLCFGF